MREIVSKPIDEVGRVVIPAEWRKGWGKRVIVVRLSGDEVLVRPLRKRGKLTDLVDAIGIEDVEDFTDTDQLRRSIYG
jgi:bifunctional DNA-binding transcriptional regulator/antitoxin component of YhaV-PrlF toxin-antitoxin module